MSSPHIVDTASRARQLTQFFQQRGREKNKRMQAEAAKKQNDFLATLKSGAAHPGKFLSHQEIVKRLKTLNPNLIFMQSTAYPEQGGIYLHDGRSNLDDINEHYRGLRMVAAMGWGIVPENTAGTVSVDEKGDEQGKITKKGWRTTLACLISMRLISLTGAEKVFGSGGKGWHERLH